LQTVSSVSDRKKEHLETALRPESQAGVGAGWDDVHLVPATLPELSPEDVDASAVFAGTRLMAPLIIASMTGGHADSMPINAALATAAERLGIGIGSGSQRAALRDPSLRRTYAVIRENAPTTLVFANIGICQLVAQGPADPLERADIEGAVEMLDAQMLIVHLNVAEELIQPEGDRALSGLLNALEELCAWSPVPVVAKETGSGMPKEAVAALANAGVAAVDVGGAGGTSFARIEGLRAELQGDRRGARLGETFGDWGIPTAISVLEAAPVGLPVVATGGVRNGLDAAKAIALGAQAVGLGRAILEAAMKDADAVIDQLEMIIEELRIAMVLTGCADVATLGSRTPVLTGMTREWALQRELVP
jgi:isopentenyl-diphosphate delta-isomerase